MIKYCESCLGRCPENCEGCVYYYCEKEVDYHLVKYQYRKMLNSIGTPYEAINDYNFIKWYKAYFGLNK